jgi:hypothetical protein
MQERRLIREVRAFPRKASEKPGGFSEIRLLARPTRKRFSADALRLAREDFFH